MKKCIYAIAALLSVGLAPAAEVQKPRFQTEILQALTAPIPEKDIQHVSEPNSRGQRIIVFERREGPSEWKNYLALKEPDGQVRHFYRYHFNVEAPEVTHQILWLGDDRFACVCSGRLNSYYGVYDMAGAPDREYPELQLLIPVATGVVHYRITWRVQDKVLIGGSMSAGDSSAEEEFVEFIHIGVRP